MLTILHQKTINLRQYRLLHALTRERNTLSRYQGAAALLNPRKTLLSASIFAHHPGRALAPSLQTRPLDGLLSPADSMLALPMLRPQNAWRNCATGVDVRM
jgi:hypothetical protein